MDFHLGDKDTFKIFCILSREVGALKVETASGFFNDLISQDFKIPNPTLNLAEISLRNILFFYLTFSPTESPNKTHLA